MTPYYKNDLITLYQGDCLEIMPQLDMTFDCCITDLPYGVTKNKWDSLIPFEQMWNELNKLVKNSGAMIFFGQDKFSAKLMLSNEKYHRYNLIWKKGNRASGFLNSKRQPLRNHEDIMFFYREQPTYNPQMTKGNLNHSKGILKKQKNNCYGDFNDVQSVMDGLKYPKSVIDFEKPHPQIYPTQKPVELLEYLIKTYTNENDIILDFTAGSGTTGIASMNLNRKCVLIEKDINACELIVQRLHNKEKEIQGRLF
jgi:site-specific DNA-methyltransferase (adenine-specific)